MDSQTKTLHPEFIFQYSNTGKNNNGTPSNYTITNVFAPILQNHIIEIQPGQREELYDVNYGGRNFKGFYLEMGTNARHDPIPSFNYWRLVKEEEDEHGNTVNVFRIRCFKARTFSSYQKEEHMILVIFEGGKYFMVEYQAGLVPVSVKNNKKVQDSGSKKKKDGVISPPQPMANPDMSLFDTNPRREQTIPVPPAQPQPQVPVPVQNASRQTEEPARIFRDESIRSRFESWVREGIQNNFFNLYEDYNAMSRIFRDHLSAQNNQGSQSNENDTVDNIQARLHNLDINR